jgi:hypothetical protein
VLERGVPSFVWAEGRILYSTTAVGRLPARSSDLWEVPVDPTTGRSLGAPARLAVPDNLTFNKPTISQDGSALLFMAVVRESHVFVAEFDPVALSLGPIRQAVFTSSYESPLAWTPTGDSILFHMSGPRGFFRIFTQPVDRPEPHLVIPESHEWAAASPDGRAIYHVSIAAPWRLLRVPAAGGIAEAVFDLTTLETQIKCSLPPASRCVLAQRATPSVPALEFSWFDPRGGTLQRGAVVAGWHGGWDITSDGSEIAYLDGSVNSPGRLEVVDLTGRRISSIESPSLRGAQFLAWTRDRRGWVVAKRGGDRGGEVFHIDGRARVTTLWSSPDMSLNLPLLSPDGRRIVFAAGWAESNVMRLRGF